MAKCNTACVGRTSQGSNDKSQRSKRPRDCEGYAQRLPQAAEFPVPSLQFPVVDARRPDTAEAFLGRRRGGRLPEEPEVARVYAFARTGSVETYHSVANGDGL